MKRGPQRYSKEVIRSAIKKREDGGTLSGIAKEMGLPKTTVKYWLDNPHKFLSDRTDRLTPDGRIVLWQSKILDYGWKYVHHLCKTLTKKEENASFREIMTGIKDLSLVLGQIQIVGGHEPATATIVEVSEQTSITYRRFLDKKKEMESAGKGGNNDLSSEPPDPRPGAAETAGEASAEPLVPAENGANG
jgi:hypothetical protein